MNRYLNACSTDWRKTGPRLVALGLVAGLGAACAKTSTDRPASLAPEVGVVTIHAQRVVLTTELPGRTSPYLVADVRPQVNGIIQKRAFVEGSDVAAGSLLYQIDPAPYQAAYEQARASLAVAEANVPALRSRVERLKDLVTARAVGQQDYDDAVSALARAEAGVLAAKAAVESARINVDYTPVRSPISGRVGRSAVTVGALVTAYQAVPLATVQQLDPIYVDVTQATADILRLTRRVESGHLKGTTAERKVNLLLEDGTPYPAEGRLQFRDVSVDQATGSVVLRMVFPNPRRTLLPGMFVRAIVEEGESSLAILAPQQGVGRDQKGTAFALVVGAGGKVEKRELRLDRAIGPDWLVTSGLASGDRLIVEGREKVRPGTAVRPVPLATDAQPVPAPQVAAAK